MKLVEWWYGMVQIGLESFEKWERLKIGHGGKTWFLDTFSLAFSVYFTNWS